MLCKRNTVAVSRHRFIDGRKKTRKHYINKRELDMDWRSDSWIKVMLKSLDRTDKLPSDCAFTFLIRFRLLETQDREGDGFVHCRHLPPPPLRGDCTAKFPDACVTAFTTNSQVVLVSIEKKDFV